MGFFQWKCISVTRGACIWLQVKDASGQARWRLSQAQAKLSQGGNTTEMFFQEIVPEQNVATFIGGKWFQILAFVFMENGENFEGKPQNPLLLLKPQKLINF